MTRPYRILISTGELSGDYHAAHLVRALRTEAAARGVTLHIAAVGSTNLTGVADEMWEDSTGWASIGFVDSSRKYPIISSASKRVMARMRQWKPDLVIGVDFRVVHVRLLKAAKAAGFRTAYYFAPVHWGGARSKTRDAMVKLLEGEDRTKRKPDRFDLVAAVADLVILAYPISQEHYTRAGANWHYFGHPLANALESELSEERDVVRARHLDGAHTTLVGVFPGSRDQELRDIWPLMRDCLVALSPRHPEVQWYVSCAHPRYRPRLERDLAALPETVRQQVSLVEGADPNLLRASDLVLIKSGTATQSALLLEVPMVPVYRFGLPPIFGPFLLWFSRKVFLNLPYYTFPNILAQERVVPELIQEAFTTEALIAEMEHLLGNPAAREAQREGIRALRATLYSPDTIERSAGLCLDLITGEPA